MCRNNCHGDALSEEKKGFWEEVSDWYQEAEPPQGFQGDLWLLRYLSAFSVSGKQKTFFHQHINGNLLLCSTHLLGISSCDHPWHGFQRTGMD